jgi:uncharacterized membrane protein
MKIRWRYEIFPLLLLAAVFVLAFVALPHAPDKIPIHWGFSGEPDNYAGKFWGLFSLPVISVLIYTLLLFLPRIDPGRKNYEKFQGIYLAIRTIIILAFTCIQLIVVLWALNIKVNVNIAVMLITGFLLMLLGNFMGKLRPTWFVGIRLPWTLSSDESWNKTHRLGGWLFVVFGLALVIAAPFQNKPVFYILWICGGLALVFLCFYSYLAWKKDPNARSLNSRSSGW